MDHEVQVIKFSRLKELSAKHVLMVVKDDDGYHIEQWSPTGVAPVSVYESSEKAAARMLQLLRIKVPVVPQAHPEVAGISLTEG